MEQRLSIITLGVADLQRSRKFYDALGWKIASEAHAADILAYDLPAMTLALYPLDKLADDAKVAMSDKIQPSFTLAYNVSSEQEVEEVLQEAIKAGGKCIKPAEKVFWGGYSGYFADPDGYLWEVAHNPYAPLGPKGEFQWNGAG